MTWKGVLLRQVRRIVLTVLICGLLGAAFVRWAPGYGVDERELDSRLSAETRQAMAVQDGREKPLAAFLATYCFHAVHGNFGKSRTFKRPVQELIAERLPITLRALFIGMSAALALGFLLGLFVCIVESAEKGLLLMSTAILGTPSAALALLFVWMGASPDFAIALIVFPYVFTLTRNLLQESQTAAHVITAEAKGVRKLDLWIAHIIRPALPQLLMLIGVAATVAWSASIPVEVVSDRAGIGQLAWQAALGRDLPVLVAVTMLIALFTTFINACADLAASLCSSDWP